MASRAALAAACIAATAVALLASTAPAQDERLLAPPRFDDGRPGEARLAPLEGEDREALEEIVVVGESEWRLPDLGTALREQREAERAPARIRVAFLPLYDPEAPGRRDFLYAGSELDRVGFIELFRVRFGGRRVP